MRELKSGDTVRRGEMVSLRTRVSGVRHWCWAADFRVLCDTDVLHDFLERGITPLHMRDIFLDGELRALELFVQRDKRWEGRHLALYAGKTKIAQFDDSGVECGTCERCDKKWQPLIVASDMNSNVCYKCDAKIRKEMECDQGKSPKKDSKICSTVRSGSSLASLRILTKSKWRKGS